MIRKVLSTACLLLTMGFILKAQAPERFSYQSVIRNANDELLANESVSIRISILQNSQNGTAVYVEEHSATTNQNGLVSLQVGAGNVQSGNFSNIDWAQGPFFIKTETDPEGGNNFSISGTSELLSVPYALHALNGGVPGPQGPQGPAGADGQDGADGVGVINTSISNDSLFVELSNGQIINAGLAKGPKGDDGAQGPQGIQGIQGPAGADGTDGQDGADGISVVNTSITDDSLFVELSDGQTINAGLAKGPKGDDGAQGPQGIQGIQGPAGTDGQDGADGISVVNTSITDDSLFVELSDGQTINAGLAKGPKGDDGAPGPQGDPGVQGPAGADGQDGADGISVVNTSITDDSLFVELSDGQTINAGLAKGADGIDGIGIVDSRILDDSLYVYLSNGDSLNAGELKVSGASLPQGATEGDLLYWDGNEWALVPVGAPGQILQLNTNGTPQWLGGGYASVETDPVGNIGADRADFSGEVTADGGSAVTERGFVYSTDPSPNLTDSTVIVGSGTGTFSTTVTGLMIGQTYYVRAYATNSIGTVYGNELTFQTNSSYALGDFGPAGGLIFYDKGSYSDGWRYMEANPADLSTGTDWGCSGTLIPGSQPSAIGNGPQNTQDIVDNCGGTNIAARLCDNYSLNGFDDWFLPSRQELDQMYQNLYLQGRGSFNGLSTYWSSTENNNISAQGVSFNSGNPINNNKVTSYRVRAARRF